jgi:hypothetical protein
MSRSVSLTPGGIIEFSERLTDSATRTKGKAHSVTVQLAIDAKEALGLKFFWVGILGFVARERPSRVISDKDTTSQSIGKCSPRVCYDRSP